MKQKGLAFSKWRICSTEANKGARNRVPVSHEGVSARDEAERGAAGARPAVQQTEQKISRLRNGRQSSHSAPVTHCSKTVQVLFKGRHETCTQTSINDPRGCFVDCPVVDGTKRCYQAYGRPSHLYSSPPHSPSRRASHRSLVLLEVWPLQHSRVMVYSGKGNVKTS